MSLTLPAARQAIAARLTTISGWSESGEVYDRFDTTSNLLKSQTFAVGIPSADAESDRQKPAQGAYVKAQIRVAFAQKMRPQDKVASYDDGLSAGRALVKALLTNASPWPGEQQVSFESLTGGVSGSGEWFLGEAVFVSRFRLDLVS